MIDKVGIGVADKFYFFLVDQNLDVVWHSKRKYSGEKYKLT